MNWCQSARSHSPWWGMTTQHVRSARKSRENVVWSEVQLNENPLLLTACCRCGCRQPTLLSGHWIYIIKVYSSGEILSLSFLHVEDLFLYSCRVLFKSENYKRGAACPRKCILLLCLFLWSFFYTCSVLHMQYSLEFMNLKHLLHVLKYQCYFWMFGTQQLSMISLILNNW